MNDKQFERAKAIAVLECMAIDLTGALAESSKTSPMTEVLEQRLEAIDTAQAALRERDVTDINVGNKWISVEERLPTGFVMIDPDTNYRELDEYIVFVKGATYPTFAHFVNGEFVPPCTECKHAAAVSFANKVTHWMPLPEPPKEV